MSSKLTIGTVNVAPGEKAYGGIETNTSVFGEKEIIPIIVVRGKKDGPILWLNGATHGDEPEGPYSIFMALDDIDPESLAGTVVAVPVMNVGAFAAGNRGNPLDTFAYDLNRVYPGSPDGYPTERIADAHWNAMKDVCDLQIALHSGGEHSYLAHMIFATDNPQSMELAAAMGPQWPLVFPSPSGGGNPSSMIGNLGKAGITAELGGNCRLLTSDFDKIAKDLRDSYLNVMRHYDMIEGEATYASEWMQGYQQALLAPASGMWVGSPDVEFERMLSKGTELGKVYNVYGNVTGTVQAPQDGVVFGLRSRASVLEGEWCCFFGIVERTVDNLIP